ncbi:secretion system protein E [Enterococcus sp. JM4C]|uniref:competence type IV pilus ATPase ComGA n=1 Tax=Candidatus Enterococcus huntleyi TaxID=1857217 RepID=UPI00137B4829|nr:competence type IV pilus ATPase ComGA [Enterococcus sp. JM4C]KAF1299086.1 secretion system protein E [Enterococcus sp. JM4C]
MIQQLSDELVIEGKIKQVQDVYVLPKGQEYQIIYRRNDQWQVQQQIEESLAEQLISRFKYLGQMDVGERRKAQLGACTYLVNGEVQRLRISTVGNYRQQESLVLRFLHAFGESQLLYFCPEVLEKIREETNRRGLYLFGGPVGSGKTTLMYALAKKVHAQVITIEDPVEIEEEQFLQLQINHKIQQDYETLIKLSLRHHPDVLIIGEIRDRQTALAAIRAALTGHRVYATIHAKSLTGIRERLEELTQGQATEEIDNCLNGIIYQRLLTDHSDSLVKGLVAYQLYHCQQTTAIDWNTQLKELYEEGRVDEETYKMEEE